jgi:hypothetical protein
VKTSNENDTAEALRIHQFLVNRIATRAQLEGTPLTPLELRQFESERMSKDEYWEFDKEFGGVDAWQPFLEKVGGLLRRAIEEDAVNDPTASAHYEALVHDLENDEHSFTLWACCVPAISGYKSVHQYEWRSIAILLAILAVIAYILLHALKIL